MDLQNCHRFNLGSPVLPSHPSNWELEDLTGLHLSFWRRLLNYVNTWLTIYSWFNDFVSKQQEIAEKYFGKDIPRVIDVARNMSLILMNREPLLAYARPEIPNVSFISADCTSRRSRRHYRKYDYSAISDYYSSWDFARLL